MTCLEGRLRPSLLLLIQRVIAGRRACTCGVFDRRGSLLLGVLIRMRVGIRVWVVRVVLVTGHARECEEGGGRGGELRLRYGGREGRASSGACRESEGKDQLGNFRLIYCAAPRPALADKSDSLAGPKVRRVRKEEQ